MEIQVKDIDAAIATCEEIRRILDGHYGEHAGMFSSVVRYLDSVWQSNAQDKEKFTAQFKKIDETSISLYEAMNALNSTLLNYVQNVKGISSKKYE